MKSLSLLLPLGCLACGEPLAPVIDAAAVPIEFSVATVDLHQPRLREVQGTTGAIILRFSFETINLGYLWHPSLTQLPVRNLHFSVVAEAGAGQWAALTHHQYLATLGPLPPGRYPLTVVHRLASERRETTVFRGTVVVR